MTHDELNKITDCFYHPDKKFTFKEIIFDDENEIVSLIENKKHEPLLLLSDDLFY